MTLTFQENSTSNPPNNIFFFKKIFAGKVCLLDIDVQGVRSLRTALEGDGSGLLPPLKVVFVRPPSLQDLERRLRDRGTEEEGAIQKVRGEESIFFPPKKTAGKVRYWTSICLYQRRLDKRTWHAAWASVDFFKTGL